MPPPKKAVIFVHERFMAARHEEGCHDNMCPHIFACYSQNTVKTIERHDVAGLQGQQHNNSGDNAGGWFQNLGGGYRRTTKICTKKDQ